jgi:hypothetical protein
MICPDRHGRSGRIALCISPVLESIQVVKIKVDKKDLVADL